MSVKKNRSSTKGLLGIIVAVVVFAFLMVGGINAISRILVPIEIEIEVIPKVREQVIGEETLGAFEEWFTFDDTENVSRFENNVEIEEDLIVNGLGGNIIAGDSVLLTSNANATKTCGVYREENDTGADIDLLQLILDVGASSTPTSSVKWMFDILPPSEASSSIARFPTDDTASGTGNLWVITTPTTTSNILYDSYDYAGLGNATSWPEDYYLCVTASSTHGDASTSDERFLCGGNTGGCEDASTTVNYGYFKWFGIEK